MMTNLRWLLLLMAWLTVADLANAQEKPKRVEMSDATKKATAKALAWLKDRQNDDGSYSDGAYAHNTAITAYAMLAFMSQGHLPNQGLYGPEVAKAARFLVASQKDDGYLVGARGGNMYCHAMATLALAELYGQTGDDALKKPVEKATALIVMSQSDNGGWRYEPRPSGADISVTIMQVMALRAAKNAGMHVPDSTKDKALAYIRSCYKSNSGGFTYMPSSGKPGFARTAAGLCVLFLSGEYGDKDGKDDKRAKNQEVIDKSVGYLKANFNSFQHFYYGHYYASHAMHQVGGKEWEEWYGRLVDYFVTSGSQSSDGSWGATRSREVGPVYQTSIAVIVLSVPAHYLPIFQR
jgi:squalene cyclase